jgi:hypothetical protein
MGAHAGAACRGVVDANNDVPPVELIRLRRDYTNDRSYRD